MIKQSEKTIEYGTGAVRGETKGMPHLMPLNVLAEWEEDHMMRWISEMLGNINDRQKVFVICKRMHKAFTSMAFDNFADMVIQVSEHFEEGLNKYGKDNWKKGIPLESYIDSMVRHYVKWLDNWDDEDHARAFMWNLMCFQWTYENIEREKE